MSEKSKAWNLYQKCDGTGWVWIGICWAKDRSKARGIAIRMAQDMDFLPVGGFIDYANETRVTRAKPLDSWEDGRKEFEGSVEAASLTVAQLLQMQRRYMDYIDCDIRLPRDIKSVHRQINAKDCLLKIAEAGQVVGGVEEGYGDDRGPVQRLKEKQYGIR